MKNNGKRRRKRNRSTPTHTEPNKKSKSLKNIAESEQSGDQSDGWLDIGSDTDSVSGSSNIASVNNVTVPNDSTSVLGDVINPCDSSHSFDSASTVHGTDPGCSEVLNSSTMAEGQVFGQGNVVQDMSSIGPMSGTDQQGSQSQSMLNGVNVSGACYGQPPVVGYQQTFSQLGMQPMQHMQTAPPISDMDVIYMRIATCVTNQMRAEVTKMVSLEVKNQTQHLTSRITDLENENAEIKSALSELTLKTDELEQYSRRSCVRISGIKESQSENVNGVVGQLIDRLNLDVKPEDIDRMHRVGRPDRVRNNGAPMGPRDIIVKLCNSNARLQLLKGRKPLRDNNEKIFISEDLTSTRMTLAYKCREHVRDKNSEVSKTWTFNGNVLVKDRAGNISKIVKEEDLDTFKPKSKPSRPTVPQPSQSGTPMAH